MRVALSNTSANNFHIPTLSSSVGSILNKFQAFNGNLKSVIPCRFTLQKDETFRVPSACRELEVLSGTAWITVDGKDILLKAGEKALIPSDKDSAIVSALGNTPLTLQVLSFVG